MSESAPVQGDEGELTAEGCTVEEAAISAGEATLDRPVDRWTLEEGWRLGREYERSRLASPSSPAYCPVHEHYKWCEHNGGVLGQTGYETPSSPTGKKGQHER